MQEYRFQGATYTIADNRDDEFRGFDWQPFTVTVDKGARMGPARMTFETGAESIGEAHELAREIISSDRGRR